MNDIASLLQQGTANPWLFIPSAILLGALHGLEPGHSKTMMAAFIIAVRGTVTQAVLLGLAATISHTAVVWIIALIGLHFGQRWDAEANEPYFQLLSAVFIIGIALWMVRRTWQSKQACFHDHSHGHEHHDHDGHDHHHDENDWLGDATSSYQDPHELAHANDIKRRFANRQVTTGQIIMFGLTGGLIPCPASITLLLICLQLKQIALGVTLVLCFSIGLALTMVLSGALAALSVKHASRRWNGFGEFAKNAPYFSGALILLVGFYVGFQGLIKLI